MGDENLLPVIIALLSFLGTSVGSYFSHKKTTHLMGYRLNKVEEGQSKTEEKQCKVDEINRKLLMESKENGLKIDNIEKKLDKHNRVIERTYEVEKMQSVLDKELRGANHRIKDLECEMKELKGAM